VIEKSRHRKHYDSARFRFLAQSVDSFLARELPQYFGPVMRQGLVRELVRLIEKQLPARRFLRPGQCLWNAISVETRPDHPHRKLVPVILTLITEREVERLSLGESRRRLRTEMVARLCEEARDQGALLSMRDISLLVWRADSEISLWRQRWEREQNQILPHPGSWQDFGTTLTHKTAIVSKVVVERKDPRRVAQETRHSQRAVDRYLTDFNRVRTAYEQLADLEFVCRTTGLSRNLVRQYLKLLPLQEKSA